MKQLLKTICTCKKTIWDEWDLNASILIITKGRQLYKVIRFFFLFRHSNWTRAPGYLHGGLRLVIHSSKLITRPLMAFYCQESISGFSCGVSHKCGPSHSYCILLYVLQKYYTFLSTIERTELLNRENTWHSMYSPVARSTLLLLVPARQGKKHFLRLRNWEDIRLQTKAVPIDGHNVK